MLYGGGVVLKTRDDLAKHMYFDALPGDVVY